MNKKVLALAISAAAVSTVHAAEIYNDNNGYSLEMGGRAEARMAVRDGNVEDNSRVRLNLLGTAEITDNLYGVGFYEGEFTTNDFDRSGANSPKLDNRYGYAGIGGAFGEVTYGKNDGALAVITDFTDIMMYHGNSAAYKLAVADRTDNMLSYAGSFDGLDVRASYRFADPVEAGDELTDNGMDGYSLSAIYTIGDTGVALGAGLADQDDTNQYNLVGSYTMDNLYFAGIYTSVDFDGDEYTGFELAAAYTMGQMRFTTTYNNAEIEGSTLADVDNFAIDAAYFFKPNFYGYASYNLNLLDSDEVGNIASQDEIALGLRFDF